MADKEKDEDKFEDDEDFGLPELHYEELDDDTDSTDAEADDTTDEKSEDVDKVADTTEEIENDPFAVDSPSESSEDSFYEAESFDEFKDDSTESASVFDSDDTSSEDSFSDSSASTEFGSDSYSKVAEAEPFTAYYDDDTAKKAKSNFAKIVVIGTLLFASIAIVFVFMMDGDGLMGAGEEEKMAPIPEPEPVVEETVVDTSASEDVEPATIDPTANQATPGEINTIEQRTGKSYVVIGSFFDGDLAMDFAKKLAENGNSPTIIPPFKDYRFHRVAIAEFDTFKDAEAQAPSYAEQFGREAWPLRY